ncbi:serine/threonine-protein kinase WNK1-like isoform X1 [Vanessa atalanta]|uniref:serine/threonine-protein kinase WNK1-like isoform X1 n=1 Tax=Vanessa atalanta TaxID=42275 RepID=UPI001FCD3341|nr:serine/threonine-protein kinase WNK1-like isoform X1 [Vanessa atalanta]
MSNNLETDRSVTTGKMYPIDLAPQKITIVKSMTNSEVKMAHLISGQPKTTSSTGSMGLMRTAAQIISPGVASQPQMIVSGSPLLQGTQIVSQGSQLIGQSSQIIPQSQLLPSGQILSPGTQIISQGTQLSAQVSNASNTVSSNVQSSNVSSGNGAQLLSVGSLVSGAGNLVVSSSVRTIPPSVRVLPPMPQQNNRPVLSNINVNNTGGVLVNKGVTSHVPRGLAAGASLAVRPVTNPQPAASQGVIKGGAWSSGTRGGRGRALVYGCRARSPAPRAAPPAPPPQTALATLPTTTVLTSSGVISSTVRGPSPRTPTPTPPVTTAPRPLPLLQRNYQPAKVVGVASVGVRGVGNSAPPQLYYEVPRPAPHSISSQQQPQQHQQHQQHQPAIQQQQPHQHPRPLTPYAHVHTQSAQVSVVNTAQSLPETRQTPASVQNSSILPRPSILRKRDIDGSPTKSLSQTTLNNVTTIVSTIGSVGSIGSISSISNMVGQVYRSEGTGWEDVPTGAGSGSTTISAPSSPAPDLDPDPPTPEQDLSPRKKPRKQILSSEVRQCDYPSEDVPPSPPPAASVTPLPKRPSLSSTYVCGWRSTDRHFTRPADVRRKEPRTRDIVAIASQKHVLTSAEGWKVHHLTAQMDDLVSLEADVGEQLLGVLRALEAAASRAHSPIHTLQHTLLELVKGNKQRSNIVCEGIQEAREDILRVFKHRNFVSDILTRQADKRCFRKHRSQS